MTPPSSRVTPDARPSGSPDVGAPRLLSLRQAAGYLGVSHWSVRDWVLAGYLPVVTLPPLRPRQGERPRKTLRRVVIDRRDLDLFVEQLKDGPGGAQDSEIPCASNRGRK